MNFRNQPEAVCESTFRRACTALLTFPAYFRQNASTAFIRRRLLSRDVDGRSRQRRMSQVLLRNLNEHPTGNRMACMGVPHPMGTC